MKKNIKSLLCLILSVIMVVCSFYGCSNVDVSQETTIKTTQTEDTEKNYTVSEETKEMADDTIQAVEQKEDLSSDEVIEGSLAEEKEIVDEGVIESDANVEQENIAYNGEENNGNGIDLLGDNTGLTYFSQADSRWANKLYTSTGNKTQTMKSSACGPTSAAMVVSSSKGMILPTTMAQLFVDKGYRTANNGTAWSCWPFIADYFGFDEYLTTTSDSKMLSYLKTDKNKDGVADYFVVASCGSGLFTTGGHYIVLVADNGGDITVFDPYLYNGKFNTASRRAAGVKVSGNSVYVTENNFIKYANTKQYWIFSNDSTVSDNTSVNYVRYVSTQTQPLTVRATPGGNALSYLNKGTKVTVDKIQGSWSHIISPAVGWCSNAYLSATKINGTSQSASTVSYKTSVNSSYRLKTTETLYSKGNLTGTEYQYLPKTEIKVLSHYSATVDYVLCVKTGRKAYILAEKLSATSSSGQTATNYKTKVGGTYRLKKNTTLNSNGTFFGTSYQYLAKTQIKVVSHYSKSVDRVYIVKLGLYRYAKVSDYA